MAELLGDQALVAATGDAFKSSRLELMLSNLTASYKLYWLKGVFDEVLAGNVIVPLHQIASNQGFSTWCILRA